MIGKKDIWLVFFRPTPLRKDGVSSSVGMIIPFSIWWKNNPNVPNHQPDMKKRWKFSWENHGKITYTEVYSWENSIEHNDGCSCLPCLITGGYGFSLLVFLNVQAQNIGMYSIAIIASQAIGQVKHTKTCSLWNQPPEIPRIMGT